MILFGVLLIIIGAVVTYFGRREGEPVARWGGIIIFVAGALLVVVGLFGAADVETARSTVQVVADVVDDVVGRSSWGRA